jgi:hypothetical protein
LRKRKDAPQVYAGAYGGEAVDVQDANTGGILVPGSNDYVLKIADAIERLWMENKAMEEILDGNQIPEWFSLVHNYCGRKENQDEARRRFAPARALLQSALKGSKDLSELLEMFQRTNRTKNPN